MVLFVLWGDDYENAGRYRALKIRRSLIPYAQRVAPQPLKSICRSQSNSRKVYSPMFSLFAIPLSGSDPLRRVNDAACTLSMRSLRSSGTRLRHTQTEPKIALG